MTTSIPPIRWTVRMDMFGQRQLGMSGYVGTYEARLFSYGWKSGEKPWRLTTMLPGYEKKSWISATEDEAKETAQKLIQLFITKINTEWTDSETEENA